MYANIADGLKIVQRLLCLPTKRIRALNAYNPPVCEKGFEW